MQGSKPGQRIFPVCISLALHVALGCFLLKAATEPDVLPQLFVEVTLIAAAPEIHPQDAKQKEFLPALPEAKEKSDAVLRQPPKKHEQPHKKNEAAKLEKAEAQSQQAQESDTNSAVREPVYNAPSLHNPPPVYPTAARRTSQEGTVILHVLVTASGAVAHAEIQKSSGSSLLDNAALDAVRKWRFIAAKKGNAPIDYSFNVPITFSLSQTP